MCILAAYFAIALLLFVSTVQPAFGQSPNDPVTTGTAVAIAVIEETSAPEPSATPIAWPTPGSDILSADGSLQGTFVLDTDGDGRASESDQPATTLVELVRTGGGYSLFTAEDGTFLFKNLPAGDYLLMFWWGPGFIGVPTWETNAGLYVATISVSEDRIVRGVFPSTMLGNPKPEGLVPFPVRSGTDGAPIPVGTLDAGGGSSAPVGLPSTGSGSDASVWPMVVGLIGLAVAAGGMSLVAIRRRT